MTVSLRIACNHVFTSLVVQILISAVEVASSGNTRFPVLRDGLQTFHLHSSLVQHFPGIKGVTGPLGLRQLFLLQREPGMLHDIFLNWT